MEDYVAARRRRFDYTHAIDRLLEPRGILLSPTVAVEGIPADGRLPETNLVGAWPASAYNSALASLTGHPAVSVPAGMCSIGIPFGLQLMAPRGSDRWLLRIASMWEQHRPWPRVAPGYAAFPSG